MRPLRRNDTVLEERIDRLQIRGGLMGDVLVVFAALLLLLLIVAFGFVGCGGPDFESERDPTPVPYKDVVATTAGFAAHWPLDETSGSTAFVNGPLAPDANGTYILSGVILGDDPVGALAQEGNFAPLFTGTNGHVDVPYLPALNPGTDVSFSIELWMKPQPGGGGTNQVLVSSRHWTDNQRRGYDIGLLTDANQPQPTVRARVFAPDANETQVNVPLSQGDPAAWRHVVFVYQSGVDGTKLSLSVGVIGLPNPVVVSDDEEVLYEPVPAQGSTLRFGAGHEQNGDPQNFFAGWLDEIAFYNAALSAGDIDAHFKAATATP
jgi:hypothetical protein